MAMFPGLRPLLPKEKRHFEEVDTPTPPPGGKRPPIGYHFSTVVGGNNTQKELAREVKHQKAQIEELKASTGNETAGRLQAEKARDEAKEELVQAGEFHETTKRALRVLQEQPASVFLQQREQQQTIGVCSPCSPQQNQQQAQARRTPSRVHRAQSQPQPQPDSIESQRPQPQPQPQQQQGASPKATLSKPPPNLSEIVLALHLQIKNRQDYTNKLHGTIKALQADKVRLQRTVADLQNTNCDLTSRAEQTKTLQDQLDQEQTQVARLLQAQESLLAIDAGNQELQREWEHDKQALAHHKSELARLQHEVDALNQQVRDFQAGVSGYQSEVARLTWERDNLQASVEQHGREVQDLRRKKKGLEGEVARQRGRERAEVEDLRARLAEMQGVVNQKEGEVSVLLREKEDMAQNAQVCERRISALTTQVAALEKKMERCQREAAKEISAMAAELETCKRTVGEEGEENAKLQRASVQAEKKVMRLQAAIVKASDQAEENTSTMAQLRLELATMDAELKQLRLQDRVPKLEEERDAWKEKFEARRVEVDRLKEELVEAVQLQTLTENHIRWMKETVDDVEKSLDEARLRKHDRELGQVGVRI